MLARLNVTVSAHDWFVVKSPPPLRPVPALKVIVTLFAAAGIVVELKAFNQISHLIVSFLNSLSRTTNSSSPVATLSHIC